MEERPDARNPRRPARTRRPRYRSQWHRFWKLYGPTVEFLLICLVLLTVLVFIGVKLVNLISDAVKPEETTATTVSTEASTEGETEPETEAPTEETIRKPVGGVIYLTFDDGPGKDTPRLLEILDKYDAKATFFLVNTGYASTIGQIAEAGHTLAMHTATHDFAEVYASEDAYFADLYKIQSVIEKYSGQKPKLLRFPGGSSNQVSRQYCKGIMTELTQRVEEMGYTYFDWNVDSDDAGSARTPTEVYLNVTNGCANRTSSVVLLHDIHTYTVDAIEYILMWGTNNGYTFEALTADSPTCHHGVNN